MAADGEPGESTTPLYRRTEERRPDMTNTVFGSLFVYAPNKIAPIVFAVLYGISAVGHLWQC